MWEKKGIIYCTNMESDWNYSHCHKPTPLLIDDSTMRVYFGVRDIHGKTRTTYIDTDISDIENIKVIGISSQPVIDLGKIGCFDDSGANVCSVVKIDSNTVYMYYIGWNPSTTVHTRNSIGLAVSHDNGTTFKRMFDGSILDRTKDEPYYTGAVEVIKEDIWKCWYTYGHEWKIINNKPEIFYYIRYATSKDGIDWERNAIDCILPDSPYECTARPSVLYENGKYHMWYSKRHMEAFRETASMGYRGGYASSIDGIHWDKNDSLFNIEPSIAGFDDSAIAYPYVIKIKDNYIMLYNGNGFGKTGFGYAILRKPEQLFS